MYSRRSANKDVQHPAKRAVEGHEGNSLVTIISYAFDLMPAS